MALSGRVLMVGALLAAVAAAMRPWLDRESRGGGVPDVGRLATSHPEWLGPWRRVVAVSANASAPAGIVAIGQGDSSLVLLSEHDWWLVRRGRVTGPFGTGAQGAPGWLRRGVAVIVRDDSAFILDAGRDALVVVSLEDGGTRSRRVSGDAQPGLDQALVVDRAHRATVTRLVYGSRSALTGDWQVLRLTGSSQADTLYDMARDSIAGDPFAAPQLALLEPDRLILIESGRYRIRQLSPMRGGAPDAVRRDAPRWRIPDSIRVQYQALAGRLPEDQRARWHLPEYFPAVRSAIGVVGSRLLVSTPAGGDAVYLEIVTVDGSPEGRLLDEALTDPIFLTSHALYRVRETSDSTTVDAASLHLP